MTEKKESAQEDKGTPPQEKGAGEEKLMPFMDTFYSLASNDATERSYAASSMIKHIFFGQANDKEGIDALIKDGTYAMTRLMKGLCSGRASARQGFASCLATFLRLSFRLRPNEEEYDDLWIDLFRNNGKEQVEPAEFVRNQLSDSTNVDGGSKSMGKKSRSEERDHRFGRLFGILAVVRSGTLVDASEKVIQAYVADLIDLYNQKAWLKEPSVHALKELFSYLSSVTDNNAFDKLVENSLGSFLQFEKKSCPWSAEKIAFYLHLQTIYMDKNISSLPKCIQKALLTSDNLDKDIGGGTIKLLLRDTSTTVYPKTHLVWSSVWGYLSETVDGCKILRQNLMIGTESASDILSSLVKRVIVATLLGDDSGNDGNNSVTPSRRALGLSLIQQLLALSLPADILENVILQKTVVMNFISSLQKTSAGKKTNSLKPLAIEILQKIVLDLCSGSLDDDTTVERRAAASRAFLRANPSFDSVTKTDTVATLLELIGESDATTRQDTTTSRSARTKLWEKHLDFIMNNILDRIACETTSIQDANKNVDAMFSFIKRVIRIADDDDEKKDLFRKALSFLMIGAFFDLEKFDHQGDGKDAIEQSDELDIASKIKNAVERTPYECRSFMSSRFFSLFFDFVNCSSFKRAEGAKDNWKNVKVSNLLRESSKVKYSIRTMLKYGAKLYADEDMTDDMDNNSVLEAFDGYKEVTTKSHEDTKPLSKALASLDGFANALLIQLLHPGKPSDDDDEEADEYDTCNEDILDAVSEISNVASKLARNGEKYKSMEGESANILNNLASVCVNILNSEIGGNSVDSSNIRGGAPKLTREFLLLAWSSTINATEDLTVDSDVINTLLEAVCSEQALAQGEETADDDSMESDDEEDENDDDSDGEEHNEMHLSFSSFKDPKSNMEVDKDNSEIENCSDKGNDSEENMGDEDDDIELDPSKLENLLIQSSDDESIDGDILEHHEGADAALAQLLKLKQEAKKAGKKQKEKAELANRLRCMGLLEAIFVTKHSGVLSNQTVLMTLLPLLRSRTELAKSVLSDKAHDVSYSDKKALLDKITDLIEHKICKTHLDGRANLDACRVVAEQITIELRKVQDIEHCKCCSALFVLLVKAVASHGDDSIHFATSIYQPLVVEWSTKKSTKVQSVVFDNLVLKCRRIATFILTKLLNDASMNARNSYLRSESFRLLSLLYSIQTADQEPRDQDEVSTLQQSLPAYGSNICKALGDDEMMKTKRVREILKAADKLVKFVGAHVDGNLLTVLDELEVSINALAEKSESPAVKSICKNVLKDLSAVSSKVRDLLVTSIERKSSSKKTSKKKKSKKK